jgi:hypothetical protein
MDTVASYRELVRRILTDYARIPFASGESQTVAVFDTEGDHYLLMLLGREGVKRVHGCLVHVDIIGGKIWIQRDGTEDGIAEELVRAGVPKEHIVLGFRSPQMRRFTEFAYE